jgi:hypothetical protein
MRLKIRDAVYEWGDESKREGPVVLDCCPTDLLGRTQDGSRLRLQVPTLAQICREKVTSDALRDLCVPTHRSTTLKRKSAL